jgi:uncharacterized protein
MRVRVRYTKWGGHPHWECDTIRVGDDEWGAWLYSPTGTTLSRPGYAFDTEAPSITLISVDRPSTPTFWAWWAGPPHLRFAIYEDVTTLPVWAAPDSVTMVDLDLDVIRLKNGEVEVHDEDEFEQHRLTYNYPAQICESALRTCAQIRAGQLADAEPYASVGWRWLERAMAMCS